MIDQLLGSIQQGNGNNEECERWSDLPNERFTGYIVINKQVNHTGPLLD